MQGCHKTSWVDDRLTYVLRCCPLKSGDIVVMSVSSLWFFLPWVTDRWWAKGLRRDGFRSAIQGSRAVILLFWWEACVCVDSQRPDGEQMWGDRRSGTEPEQLGEIKNNSIPRDWGNYRGGMGSWCGDREIKPCDLCVRERERDSKVLYL